MNIRFVIDSLPVVFIAFWYPGLWLLFWVLGCCAGAEEPLEGSLMTDREIWSQNLAAFLWGRYRLWRIMVVGLYPTGWVLSYYQGTIFAALMVLVVLAILGRYCDYGQTANDDGG